MGGTTLYIYIYIFASTVFATIGAHLVGNPCRNGRQFGENPLLALDNRHSFLVETKSYHLVMTNIAMENHNV